MFVRQRFACALVFVCALSGRASAQGKDEVPIEEDEVPVQDDSGGGQQKPPEQKPPEQKPSEQKPPEQKPSEQKPPEQKPRERKPSEQKPSRPPADEGDEGPDFGRPPPRGKGVVWGILTDVRLNEAVDDAEVTVEGKVKATTVTDLDGRYRLELVPGVYTIRFWAELHHAEVLQNVRVEVGKVVRLDATLTPDEGAVDVIEVETEADRAAVEGQILTRQRAAAVGDSVGRAEIARTPDKNAAQAAQRVVGATIVNGRFVYVRGLGERYTNALMNDAPLPSPEPDRAAVPLDLFPTMAIESLTIAKTFTPDVPGDFAGGSVRIQTREIPSRLVLQASVTGGYNSQSTFRQRLDYAGGKTDWLGTDDGTRALPAGFPSYKLDTGSTKPDGSPVTATDLQNAGRSINTYMSTLRSTSPPDHVVSLVVGDGWNLGAERKVGVLAALSYGRSYQLIEGEISRDLSLGKGGALQRERDTLVERGIDNVSWGGLGSLTYQFNRNHRLVLIGLHSQISDDTALEAIGFNNARQGDIHETRLTFVSRALNLGQLRGEHVFPELGKGEFDWTAWLSEASREQPNTRSVAFYRAAGATTPDWGYVDDSFSGRHFWASQTESANGGKVDWTQPLAGEDSKVKLGAFANLRDRDFDSRNLALRRRPGLNVRDPAITGRFNCPGPNVDFNKCADGLLTNPNLDETNGVLQLQESTLAQDAYRASLNVYAGYLMADVALVKGFRMIAGERVEVTRQTIEPFDQFNPNTAQPGGNIKSTDLLPTLASVIDIGEKSKVRASVTRTLARPQLRELAPFAYYEFFGGRAYSGTPDLKITHITNADFRVEHFPTLKEVLAASVFYKHFQDPIETIIVASGDKGTVTYQNAEGANLYGAELEARKGLGFLTKSLKDFSLITNLTVALSSIQLSGQARLFLTNGSRPMVYQSPYIVNAAVDYENEFGTSLRLSYNLYGARITEVGTLGLPDVYQQPRHQFDFTAAQNIGKHFAIKFVAANIPNFPWVQTQGKDNRDDNVVSKYTTGSIYSLTATYTL